MCLRVGHGGAQERFAVAPDLTTMAKIIGGGLPIGALGGSAEVMAVFDPTGGEPALHHGGTFNGNPLSMVAGLAAMRKLTPDVFARLEDLTGRLRRGVETAMAEFGIRGQVLGLGSLFGIHLHDRPIRNVEDSRLRGDEAEEADRVRSELLARGVFPFTGLSGNVSTAMGDEEVDAFVAAF